MENQQQLAGFLEHTFLRPDGTTSDINRLCSEAIKYGFPVVCIPPYFVGYAADLLEHTAIKVATVIGFPMGYTTSVAKVEEIKKAIEDGADELDVVINISAVKDQRWNYVENEINSLVTAAHMKAKVIKLILETSLLTDDELEKVISICNEQSPNYVKTSTGFNGGGATVPVLKKITKHLNKEILVKASGGIRTIEDARRLISAGAHRLGSSSSVLIMNEL